MLRTFTRFVMTGTLAALSLPLAAQDCAGGRYVSEIFPAYTLSTAIQFGANTSVSGAATTLRMDVYEPTGDALPLRPLMVWSHGGSFVGGTRDGSDVKPLCEKFAKMGYVTASIDYRIGMSGFPFPGPDSADATEAVLRATQDAKAAVRWFYKDARTANTYRIDTTRIIIAGVSAGGFVALHYAYLDDPSEWPSYIDTTQAGLGGGFHGNSGNPGYPEDVIAVVNVAGALGDSAWLDTGDQPLVSLHGDQDGTVPYGSQMLTLVGVYPIIAVDGSSSIHARADHVGVPNCFYTYAGADHVPHVGNAAYTDTTVSVIAWFLLGQVCGGGGSCGYQALATPTPVAQEMSLWPNPVQGDFRVEIRAQQAWDAELVDMQGRTVRTWNALATGTQQLSVTGLPAGIYLFRASTGGEVLTRKISVE